MGYSYLAFGAGNTSGMNVGCNLNDLFWVVTWFKDHDICKLGHV